MQSQISFSNIWYQSQIEASEPEKAPGVEVAREEVACEAVKYILHQGVESPGQKNLVDKSASLRKETLQKKKK